MKKCSRCGKEKELNEYQKNKRKKDGVQDYCRECNNEYNRKNAYKYKELRKRYEQEYYSNPINRKKRNEWSKKYYAEHPEKQKARNETEYAIQRAYRNGAKVRGLEYDLTEEQFFSFAGKACVYCGDILDRPRIDRIDSNKGYTIENCAPCCKRCNIGKWDSTVDEFKEWIKRVYEHTRST